MARRFSPSEQRWALEIDGRSLPLTVRRNPRARRLILRLTAAGDGVVVTVPAGATLAQGLAFASGKSGWITDRLGRLPANSPFAPGAVVPLLGDGHRIRHRPSLPAAVHRADGEIVVGGPAAALAPRLTAWFRRMARQEIVPRVADKAARLGVRAGRISIRDTRSRWGSCAASGNLSFCWRLVMAPAKVLDYVVAHEVAHLRVRGHGAAFWDTVAGLTDDAEGARRWLRHHGAALHRYG